MIIYEVNIKINRSLYKEYINWLDLHIKLILRNDAFIKSEKFLCNKTETSIYISVHYFVSSIEKLNYYIKHESQEMRDEGIQKFPSGIVIKKRILESL